MCYVGMFGVIVLLTITKALIDGLMDWKAGGGGIPAALYVLFAVSVFMMIFMKKDTENGQRNFIICKYTAFIFGIVFFILCYQAVNRQDAPKSVASTQNQEQVEKYNKAFKKRLWQDHPELAALSMEEQNALMANMKKWIEAKPYKEAKDLLEIYESGNAEQVSWLMSKYKSEQKKTIKDPIVALPTSDRIGNIGELVESHGLWYSFVKPLDAGYAYFCETNSKIYPDGSQFMMLVMPQVLYSNIVFSMTIKNNKNFGEMKNMPCTITFDDIKHISTSYSVENLGSGAYVARINYENPKNFILLMMKHDIMSVSLHGTDTLFLFSLRGFTASFKRLLKLSLELK